MQIGARGASLLQQLQKQAQENLTQNLQTRQMIKHCITFDFAIFFLKRKEQLLKPYLPCIHCKVSVCKGDLIGL